MLAILTQVWRCSGHEATLQCFDWSRSSAGWKPLTRCRINSHERRTGFPLALLDWAANTQGRHEHPTGLLPSGNPHCYCSVLRPTAAQHMVLHFSSLRGGNTHTNTCTRDRERERHQCHRDQQRGGSADSDATSRPETLDMKTKQVDSKRRRPG